MPIVNRILREIFNFYSCNLTKCSRQTARAVDYCQNILPNGEYLCPVLDRMEIKTGTAIAAPDEIVS